MLFSIQFWKEMQRENIAENSLLFSDTYCLLFKKMCLITPKQWANKHHTHKKILQNRIQGFTSPTGTKNLNLWIIQIEYTH